MKKQLTFLFTFLFAAAFGFAQTNYGDFETVSPGFETFGGATFDVVANPAAGGLNTSDSVGLTVSSVETWDGMSVSLGGTVNFTAVDTLFTMKVYSDFGGTVLFKLENNNDAGVFVEASAEYTEVGTWQELTFNFAGAVPDVYGKIVLFFDFGGTETGINWYFDEITGPELVLTTYYDVTFRVDMNDYTESFGFVNVSGSFNGWCGDCNQMSDDDADGIYELTLPLEAGPIEFKYSLDNWAVQEQLIEGDDCTITTDGFTNRSLDVVANEVLPVVCWMSCTSCIEEPTSNYGDFEAVVPTFEGFGGATYEVVTNPDASGINTSSYVGMTATSVETWDGMWADLGGTVNFTETDTIVTMKVLSDSAGTVIFKIEKSDDAGVNVESTAEYTEVGTWQELTFSYAGAAADLYSKAVVFFDFGGTDEGINWYFDDITGPELTIITYYDVTFRVDMNQYAETFGNVFLNGTFNGWCGECNVMSDEDGDGIYELTMALEAGLKEYKFTLDGWTAQEMFEEGAECTSTIDGFTNRSLDVIENEVLPVVCWQSCAACVEGPALIYGDFETVSPGFETFGGATFDVVANPASGGINTSDSVGMTVTSVETWDGMFVSLGGTVNFTETDTTITMKVYSDSAGTVIFKIEKSDDAGVNVESSAEYTEVGTWQELTFSYAGAAADLYSKAVVFFDFGGTDAGINWYFDDITGPELTIINYYDVTFRVDMTEYTESYGNVYLNGTFNGWCGDCNMMSDDDADGIYELTLTLEEGPKEYKYTLDGWTVQEEFGPGGDCTITGDFTNRYIDVVANEVLPVVCWMSCTSCIVEPTSNYGDFEAVVPTFEGFGGATFEVVTNPDASGINTSSYVGMTATSVETWDGMWADLGGTVNFTETDTIVTMKVLSDSAGTVIFKIEKSDDAGVNVESTAEYTEVGTWQELTFSYAGAAADLYSKAVVFFDFGGTDAGINWYFDDITGPELTTTFYYDVTFRVDMNEYTETFGNVFLNGTFNGWCGDCNVMSDEDADGIYEITLTVEEGPIEFKYTLDVWTVQEEFEPGDDCTITTDGFTNRYLEVSEDVVLPVSCWQSCYACGFEFTNYGDFETLDPGFLPWGGATVETIANPLVEGIDSSDNVSKFVKSGDWWSGIYSVPFGGTFDFTNTSIFKIKVYAEQAGQLLFKLENGFDGGISTELTADYTEEGTWQEITYDFAGEATETYGKIVLIFDPGIAAEGNVWYFDDIIGPDFIPGDNVDVTFMVTDYTNASDVKIDIDNEGTFVQLFDDGTNGDIAADDAVWTVVVPQLLGFTITNPGAGNYTWDVIANGVIALGGDDLAFSLTQGQGPSTISFSIVPELVNAGEAEIFTPVIDGVEDEGWAAATQYDILKTYSGAAFDNPNDLAAYWKATWDASGLYVLVNVTSDDIHFTDYSYGQAWEQDLIEIYFDMNDTLEDGIGPNDNSVYDGENMGHYQLAFVADSNTNGSGWFSGTRGFTLNEDNSYIQEVFIPWSDLPDKLGKSYSLNSETAFGFDVYIIDNDGPENGPAQNRKVWVNDGSLVGENWSNMDEAGTLLPAGLLPTSTVTFNVDMNIQIALENFDPLADSVDIAGTFNDWSGTWAEDADSNGIYSLTVENVVIGSTVEFKARLNGSWDTSEFPFGGPNRVYVVNDTGNVVDFYYNDIEHTTNDVTFNVNMNYQIEMGNFDPATDSLDIAGTFNEWGGAWTSDEDGDGIYTLTVPELVVGDTIEFKARINGSWDTAEFTDNGPNRTYVVNGGDDIVNFWYNNEVNYVNYGDFETILPDFGTFGGATYEVVANPDTSGNNTSDNVALFSTSAETWDGLWVSIGGTIDFSNISEFKLKVYSEVAGTVLWKLEKDDDAGIFMEIEAEYTGSGTWEELTFDFTGAESGLYGKFVVFFDFGGTEVGNNWYFDDILGPEFIPGANVDVTFAITDYVGVSDVKIELNNDGTQHQLYDDGTNGDVAAGDAVWTAVIADLAGSTILDPEAGMYTMDVIADDAIVEGADDLEFTINAGQIGASVTYSIVSEIVEEGEAQIFTPVVDGVIDEGWADQTQYNLYKNFTGESFADPSDLSAYWKATWDANGIYVLVSVTDDVHYADYSYGQAYEQDLIEIYFDMNVDNLADGNGPNDNSAFDGEYMGHYQIGIVADSNATAGPWFAGERGFTLNEDNSYIQEIFVPWSNIPNANGEMFFPDGVSQIGFDVYVSDNDGPDNDNTNIRNRKVWVNDGSVVGENWSNMDEAGLLLPVGEIATTDVTINVNMNIQTEMGTFVPGTDFVDIAGTFNGWEGAVAIDTDADGIYTLVVSDLPVGSTIAFKARINGSWDTAEFPGGEDRTYEVVDGENVIDFFYNDVEVAEFVNVTFNINMSYQIAQGNFVAGTDFVDISGSFNEWAGSVAIDEDGDSIYTLTIEASIGQTLEFKARINGSWDTSEFPDGGANRTYEVVAGENIVDFWYNDEGTSVSEIESLLGQFEFYPNPTSGKLFVKANDELSDINIDILNYNGQYVLSKNVSLVPGQVEEFDLSNEKAGLYLIHIYNNSSSEVKKVILD